MDESLCDYDDGEIPIWQEPRCEPLGAPKENLCDEQTVEQESGDRIHALEEEQELLSSSVFSLTSHLAQVEFRLRQILKAPPEEKDAMLQALEEFTSRGVDSRAQPQGSSGEPSCTECVELERKIRVQRTKQTYFINKLKTQLKELEMLAAGNANFSDSRHRNLIEHLRNEIERSMEEGCHQPLSTEDLQHQIDCAVKQYTNHQLSKDEIIKKLQTHIDDMQKFLKIMKNEENESIKKKEAKKVGNPNKSESQEKGFGRNKVNDELKAETLNLMRKASNLIQIFTVSQFGCSPNTHKRYDRQPSSVVTHWGNLRAKLEMSIDAVVNLVSKERAHTLPDIYDSDSEDVGIVISDAPLTTAVRRHLAVNLRDLLQHGLVSPESTSLVPIIGCFPVRKSSISRSTHIWELILRYYDLNDGDRFNSTPARKLSQSFNLEIVGGTAITNKQSLLSCVGSIVASHTPYKRSYDAHFKAFVCAALNAHKLVIWLNIILKSTSLINSYYMSTSYVLNTGFQDALQSLDRLTQYKFNLPVDLAVKQFLNIKDVFM
ncbi:RUN domain-containing protein 1 [Aricia agestis]|uniref:RUN domain-containing protein 1 n=1 Tax=Aricia agestis TaxID=91739 RepID=UPI001C202E19|nr:RUN domain-containing protein 1 [Aricia agestis]